MRKQISPPLTASGKSALVPPGSWIYAFDAVGVHGLGDGELLAQVVPKPLEVDDGQIFFYVADIVSYSEGAPWASVELPEHVQYLEVAVFVEVRHEGKTYTFCPFMWVDKDLPFLRGLPAGFPKKLAHIGVARLHPLIPALDRPRAGLVLGGRACRAGCSLFKIRVELERPAERVPLDEFGSFALPRYFPKVAPGLGGVGEIAELIPEVTYGEKWLGRGELEVGGGPNDELELLKPTEVYGGYYFSMLLRVGDWGSFAT